MSLRRREFIAGVCGAAVRPLRASTCGVSAFTQALADLAWTDSRNVRMDLRWAGGEIQSAASDKTRV
jgi:hypothetical protein